MRPASTSYRLAVGVEDMAACHALQAPVQDVLGFPTVCAWRHGVLIGFLSTRPREETDGMVVAGPLVVSPEIAQPAIVCLRLVEAYEVVLQRAGVTLYWQRIAKDNARWKRIADHFPDHFPIVSEDDEGWWFKRILSPRVAVEVA